MKKLVYLEGLRGTAALIVVLAHFFQVFLPATLHASKSLEHTRIEAAIRDNPLNLLYNGNFSVALFFVLSGFVLTHRYFMNKNSETIVNSAKKRYFRLAVPAVASMCLAFIWIKLDFAYFHSVQPVTRSEMKDPFGTAISFFELLRLGFVTNFFHYANTYNPVLWTMTYELFGSFLVFSFVLLFGKTKLRYLTYVVLLIYFAKSYYLAFILGMLVSDLTYSQDVKIALKNRYRIPIVLIALIAGTYLSSYPYVGTTNTIYEPLKFGGLADFPYFSFYHILGATLLFVAVLQSRIIQAIFSTKWFAYIGNLSFSVYLVHFPIICTFSCCVFPKFLAHNSYGAAFALTVLCTVPIIWLVSHVFYACVDRLVVRKLAALFQSKQKPGFLHSHAETRQSTIQ